MASRWIVKRGEKERGPFTSPQLKSLANSGQLKRTDLVTKQGQNRYVAAEKVKGLFVASSSQPVPKTAPAKSKVPAQSKADDEELDFGVVEILEDDDEDPIVVLEESEVELDVVDFEEVELEEVELDVVDFDYGEEEVDFEEPKPARTRNSKRESPPPRGRSSAPSRRAPAKPAKPKKTVKKTDGEEDDEENGPWLNMVYGLACVVAGICLFIALGNEDPDTWQTRRGGAVLAVVKLLYNIGGPWMVLGLAILLSSVFFWSAFNQFRKA